MAQPATSPFEFTPPRIGDIAIGRGFESPGNRALSELTLALGTEEEVEGKWSTGATLRFVFVTCGLFWLGAAMAYFTFH